MYVCNVSIQLCVQPSTAAVNVTLLAFAAGRCAAVRRAAAAPLLLDARSCRSIFRARGARPVANPPHAAAAVDR